MEPNERVRVWVLDAGPSENSAFHIVGTVFDTVFKEGTYVLQPDARRVLLTAYADTDVAIRAINEIRLDQYLLKPWDPPEERLYPVLDDLLADWAAGYRPPFIGLRLIAGRWASMDEVADMAVFLASDRARYVNGARICVDGGMTINPRPA